MYAQCLVKKFSLLCYYSMQYNALYAFHLYYAQSYTSINLPWLGSLPPSLSVQPKPKLQGIELADMPPFHPPLVDD